MKSFQVPVRSVQPGDKLLVITDDAMDPLIWQCMMAAINEKGGEAVLCMWPRLPRHFADVPQMAIEAARGAHVVVALTTTAMSNSMPARAPCVKLAAGHVADGRIDRRILVDGGGRTSLATSKRLRARPQGRRAPGQGQENSRASRQRHRSHRRDRWFGA